MKGEPMDEDELVDGWDAYVDGRAGGLDRLSSQDREVIDMLHNRTWSPSPRPAFTAGLRSQLTASASQRRAPDEAMSRPLPPPGVPDRSASSLGWWRAALAAALVVAVLGTVVSREAGNRRSPTVSAPIAATSSSPVASSFGPSGGCPDSGVAQTHVASAFVDPTLMTEIATVLPTVRHATLQRLTRLGTGSVLPDGYDLSGVSGVVVDSVVLGAATATFQEGAWITAVDSMRFTGTRRVFPSEAVDLLRGDVVVYPAGSLVTLANALDGRNVEIARLTLHDIAELPGRATDSITVMTLARTEVDIARLTPSPVGFAVTIGYSVGLLSATAPGAACPPETGVLISGIARETPIGGSPDEGPRYGGPLVWLAPLVPDPAVGSTPTPLR